MSARSGREGASVRWLGHVDRPEPDAAAEAGAPADLPVGDDLWGGLIDYDGSYTTPTRETSSGARPTGSAQKRENKAEGSKEVEGVTCTNAANAADSIRYEKHGVRGIEPEDHHG